MSFIPEDFSEFLRESDKEGEDDERPLGDLLAELAIDIDIDSVEAVREIRERT